MQDDTVFALNNVCMLVFVHIYIGYVFLYAHVCVCGTVVSAFSVCPVCVCVGEGGGVCVIRGGGGVCVFC